MVSRQHVRLHVDSTIEIEDLGSANRTHVRDAEIDANVRMPLGIGEVLVIVVEAGETLLGLIARLRLGGGRIDDLLELLAHRVVVGLGRLHRGNLPQFMQSLPPLLTMERLLFQIIFAGFVLLTLTLGSGILFSEELFGKPMQFTHKTTFGILSWIIFGALLTGRALYGWRGRVAMRWTLAGFLSLFLAYIGSKFVLEVLLQR